MKRWQDTEWAEQMALKLDFSNMMAEFVGENKGISSAEIDELVPRAEVIAENIEAENKAGLLGFCRLPYDAATAENVLEMAARLRSECDDFVVLGIGGSALGGIALFNALCHPFHNLLPRNQRGDLPHVFFLDNIDPVTFRAVLDFVNPEKTVFDVITKSGGTSETVAQFLIAYRMLAEKLGRQAVKDHIVVTTDPGRNELRTFSEEAGFRAFSVPENVGGRFSVLSPVGLFPAAVAGIDIMELLAGARFTDQHCGAASLWQNPAYMAGALHYLADTRKKLDTAVMMPYSDYLRQVGFWFRQLWAESLGKSRSTSGKLVNVGQTPIAALGVTDQHSQLQLYQEGPFNKMITFLRVEKHSEMPIPGLTGSPIGKHLAGHSLGELMNTEVESTSFALTRAGRSNMTITLPEVNPFTVGELLFMLEVQTVFAGGLYEINPLDQPGVEASKDYIYGLTGRAGYEKKAAEIRQWQTRKGRYII